MQPALKSHQKAIAEHWKTGLRKAAATVLNSEFEIMVVPVEEEIS